MDDNIRYKIVVRGKTMEENIIHNRRGWGIKNVSFTFDVKIGNQENQQPYSMETKREDRVGRDTHLQPQALRHPQKPFRVTGPQPDNIHVIYTKVSSSPSVQKSDPENKS